jgi:pyruvate/2-oxoglutarate dehydrogenase complex dihydrolipoamide dehydrogenase (E3) component
VERCDRVVIEAGSTPNTEGLGLGAVGIETDERGFIIIDEYQQTSQPGVYALGGATGNANATHLYQSQVVIRNALGEKVVPPESIPLTIRTTPPISMLGWTEEMCQRLELDHAVGIARCRDLPSRRLLDEGEGMLKLVVTRGDRRLAGIHAIGEGASELVQVGAALVASGVEVDELTRFPFAARSRFEGYLVAAKDVLLNLAPRGRGTAGPGTSSAVSRRLP